MSNRQQQINSFMNSLTQKEIDKFISENRINKSLLISLEKIKNSGLPQTHSDRIVKEINTAFTQGFDEYNNSIYRLGQAQIIALLLNQFYDEEYKISDVKSFFKVLMDNEKELKGFVYDIMKDF